MFIHWEKYSEIHAMELFGKPRRQLNMEEGHDLRKRFYKPSQKKITTTKVHLLIEPDQSLILLKR